MSREHEVNAKRRERDSLGRVMHQPQHERRAARPMGRLRRTRSRNPDRGGVFRIMPTADHNPGQRHRLFSHPVNPRQSGRPIHKVRTVVVPKDPKRPKSGSPRPRKPAEHRHCIIIPARVVRIVTCKGNQINRGCRDLLLQLRPTFQRCLARADMKIGNVEDREPVQGCRNQRMSDLEDFNQPARVDGGA